MRADQLDVIAVIANPIGWQSRLNLFYEFEQRMLDSGVRLTTVECEYGERPFRLEADPHINRVQVRSKTLVWNKENLINIGISRLPADWKYVAWIDADIRFRKPTWAADTVNALQQYDIIQPWSDAYDLGPNDEHVQTHRSFCRQLWHGKPVHPGAYQKGPMWRFDGGPYEYPHSGYAWAATRQAIEWLGGLFELGAMGAGDHHMALSLIGQSSLSVPGGVHPSYIAHLKVWEQRAVQHINRNIGFVWGTVEHFWHGSKIARQYVNRWQMITEHQFNPDTDLKRNSYGVLELAGNKPGLALDLDRYFRQRNEDANSF